VPKTPPWNCLKHRHPQEMGLPTVPATSRAPNTRLRALITESRWTGQGLARAVNAAGTELGLGLTYDRTTVSHWLSGSRPPATVARLAAEALSRRLGRVVSVPDTGLGPPGPHPPVSALAAAPTMFAAGRNGGHGAIDESVGYLVDLCVADADPSRRAALRDLIYSLNALRGAGGRSRTTPLSTPGSGHGTHAVGAAGQADARRARGPQRAQAVRAMTELFSTAESRFGGGHIRPALTAYLSGDVANWLREPGPPDARRELTAAAAELGYLAAFVCFDCGLHGLAQRYYLASLGLAEQSGDAVLRATILRGMSVQAYALRHVRESLELAEAADAGSREVPTSRAAALAGQLAVASAANGLHREAALHLRRAERLLDACGSADEPIGAYHRAALCHQSSEVLAAAGDRRAAIDVLGSSIRQRPGGERRSRAVTVARLAHLQLDVGHLEAACASVGQLCEDVPYLHSARTADSLDALRMRLRPFARNPDARVALARIRTLRE
jgi:hypothetical protein